MRNLRHIEGTLRELLNKSNVKSTEDFIYATLTDEEIINDAMGIFQQVYPNTVKIDYNNSHTKEIEQLDISKIAENRSFSELISDFYKQMYNQEISADEMDVMRSVAKEAVETYVDFYFTHQGKSYHVKRRPEYERQKMHGSGVTLIKKLKCLVSESCCLHKNTSSLICNKYTTNGEKNKLYEVKIENCHIERSEISHQFFSLRSEYPSFPFSTLNFPLTSSPKSTRLHPT
ncbi:MAG: exonuclease SbcCD subunit D C-terminal domain-containing protein [Treponema sp.]|nr:exonuclease SbcCD subunit D C-terminal domain-containing protein [Treponema sp.]